MSENTKRISLWSGPRNISTTLMYSFAQRNDCQVVDEPLYACYLKRTNKVHPGRMDILASMSSDPLYLKDQLLNSKCDKPLVFFKNMAHHFNGFNWDLLDGLINIFLIRKPELVINSYINQIEMPEIDDLGYVQIKEMIDREKENSKSIILLDSSIVLSNPEKMLKKLCDILDIDFDSNMLHWNKGGIKEDGIWAKYWYKSLHESEGFMDYKLKNVSIPKRLEGLLEHCNQVYEQLYPLCLRP